MRASSSDPLGQASPRPGAAAAAAQSSRYASDGLEDDPDGGPRPVSFEREQAWAGGGGRDSAWSSVNPVAGAGPQSYPAAANAGWMEAAGGGGGGAASPRLSPRGRFDTLSRSMGSQPRGDGDMELLGAPEGVGVSPTYGDHHNLGADPGQSPDYGASLDRLLRREGRSGGIAKHLRGVHPGQYLDRSMFAGEGEYSPRSGHPAFSDLARAASNSNGLAWRSGGQPQHLTAAELLQRYQEEARSRGEDDLESSSPLARLSVAFGADGARPSMARGCTETGQTGYSAEGGYSSYMRSGVGENCLVIMTMVTMGCVLWVLQAVLVPLVLAVFISAMLLPMLDFVTERPFHLFGRVWCRQSCGLCLKVEQRYDNFLGTLVSSLLTLRLPNVIGLLVVVGLVLLLFFGLGILVYYSVENFMNKSDYYEAKIYNMSKEMPDWVINHMGDSGKAALSKDKLFGTLTDSAAASEVIIDVLLESEHALTTTALTMLYTVFILLGRQDRSEREKQQTLVVIEDQLQVYLSWKFVVSAVSGAVIGLTLGRLEIDLAAVFGLLTFFLNFIPTVGLLVAIVLPIPVVYLSPVSTTSKILAVLIPYGLQMVVTNFVEPLVFGRRLHLHPIFVLFSLVFWNMLWGLTGAVLSIPIMCVLKIILLNMPNPTATFIASMMEGHFEASRAARLAMSSNAAPAPPRYGSVEPEPSQEPEPEPEPAARSSGAASTDSGETGGGGASAEDVLGGLTRRGNLPRAGGSQGSSGSGSRSTSRGRRGSSLTRGRNSKDGSEGSSGDGGMAGAGSVADAV